MKLITYLSFIFNLSFEVVDIPKLSQIASYLAANKRRKMNPIDPVATAAMCSSLQTTDTTQPVPVTGTVKPFPEDIEEGCVLDPHSDPSEGPFEQTSSSNNNK